MTGPVARLVLVPVFASLAGLSLELFDLLLLSRDSSRLPTLTLDPSLRSALSSLPQATSWAPPPRASAASIRPVTGMRLRLIMVRVGPIRLLPRRIPLRVQDRGVRALFLSVLLVVIVACVGCGGNGTDEPKLGQSKDAEAMSVRRNEQRIAELRRKVARERAADPRKPQPEPDPATPSGLPGFDSFAASLGGEVGVALGPPGRGPAAVAGNLPSGAAWSTIKVPIAARVILDRGGPANITSDERSLIERAITASDNAAAAQLWDELSKRHGGPQGAATAVTEILASTGDSSTTVSTVGRDGFSPYGQTES